MAKSDKKLIKPNFDFYRLDPLFKAAPLTDFLYYIIIGERSNGKSFSVQELALKNYLEKGEQMAFIRRWDVDWKNNYLKVWDGFIHNIYKGNILKQMSGGKWNSIYYNSGCWYLQRLAEKEYFNEKKNRYLEIGDVEERDKTPFGFCFALNLEEHKKGTQYPGVTTILFDEFITRKAYLNGGDEYTIFCALVSTIVRLEVKARIFMCANTISKECPYFYEMGLRRVKDMKQGQIDIYEYGDSGLRVAVEYCDTGNMSKVKKASNKYFAFDNPKLKSIRDGAWEVALYPHMPLQEVKPKEILYIYFIVWNDDILQCEIIQRGNIMITYIHRKTTPIKDDGALVYQKQNDPRPNYARRISYPVNKLQSFVARFFTAEKVYYQDNDVGEIVRAYLDWQSSPSSRY